MDEKSQPIGLLNPGEQDAPATRVPSGRLTPSVPAQDLSRDLLIAYAPRRQFAGALRPALDGIPLLAKLAQAGMAAVYYGIHPWLNIEVAVKVLPFHLGEQDPQAIERFIREARNAAQASSRHLVSVKDVKQDSGICFIVMEFVRGQSAEDSLKQARESGAPGLPEAHALEICIAATEGLAAAHRQGILHRNIRTSKILIPCGESGALDFAAAKLSDLSNMTPGTPGFMAPEQGLSAKKAGKPADVFSMGATLYALLAGRAPFTGETGLEIMLHTLQDPHTPLREARPGISAATSALVGRCLAKKPEVRYPDGAALLTALKEACAPLAPKPCAEAEAAHEGAEKKGGRPLAGAVRADGVLGTLLGAKEAVAEYARRVGLPAAQTLDLGGSVELELVLIPAGKFTMGSPEAEKDRDKDETLHEVTISRPFYMGKYQVTQEQYEAVMGGNPSAFAGARNPVEVASWGDAQDFCKKASVVAQASGLRPRSGGLRHIVCLPTEAQWEYACRAGTRTPFHTGKTISSQQANINGNDKWGIGTTGIFRERTTPVGSFAANAWGLYDMHGNVWEWCQDWYGEYPKEAVTDPQGAANGEWRVLRGGAWCTFARNCRAAHRNWLTPDYRNTYVGFRVCAVVLG